MLAHRSRGGRYPADDESATAATTSTGRPRTAHRHGGGRLGLRAPGFIDKTSTTVVTQRMRTIDLFEEALGV